MNGYTKVFGTILTSTIWREPTHVKVVWITMLALSDSRGRIKASVPGLAHMACLSLEQTEDALARFMAPDKYSRTKDFEGRRIEELPEGGGWRLLNHSKYKHMCDEEQRREQYRLSKAKTRARAKAIVDMSTMSTTNVDSPPRSTHTDTDTDTDTKKKRSGTAAPSTRAKSQRQRKPETGCPESGASPEEVAAWAAGWNIPTGHPEFTHFLDGHRKKDSRWRDWGAAWRTWLRNVPVFARQPRHGPQAAPEPPSREQSAVFAKDLAKRVLGARRGHE